MAASWKNLDICRIFSLHKECAFVDLEHKGNVVTSINFDRFGGFLMTSAGNELTLFNYKSWKKPIGVLRIGTPVQSALFDMNCSKIFAGSQTVGTIKMLTL